MPVFRERIKENNRIKRKAIRKIEWIFRRNQRSSSK